MIRRAFPACLILLAVFAMPASAQQGLTPETVQKVKAATVFIKVSIGGSLGTGSGFVVKVDGTTVYVVTNQHVVEFPSQAPPGTPPEAIKKDVRVVFDSGTEKEKTVVAQILSADAERDLAVLKMTVEKPPAPLDLTNPPNLIETMPVFVCGFPFGAQVVAGMKNPEISIGIASVSSIRKQNNIITGVQLNGALNPGNSGGPVVAADGKLVGVARATIKGAGLGLAIPQQEVTNTLTGRPGQALLVPGPDNSVLLEVKLIDPLNAIMSVVAHYRPTRPDVLGPNNIMPDAIKIDLELARPVARGKVDLPPEAQSLWVQFEFNHAGGKLMTLPSEIRPAVAAPMGVPGVGPGPAVRPMTPGNALPPPQEILPPAAAGSIDLPDLNKSPEKHVGQTVEVNALTGGSLFNREDGYELGVHSGAGKPPSNVRVIIPKDLACQINDLGVQPEETFAVRLKGTIAKPTARGESRFTFDVKEIGFLNNNGEIANKFAPSADIPSGDPTIAILNRFPEKFVGKSHTFETYMNGIGSHGQGYEVRIINEFNASPLNLEFYTSKSAFTQVEDELPRGAMRVRITAIVEKISAKTGKGIVGVTKFEVLNGASKAVLKTVNADDKIIYPVEAGPKITPKSTPTQTPTSTKAAAGDAETQTHEPKAAASSSSTIIFILIGVGAVGLIGLCVVGLLAMKFMGKGKADKPSKSYAKTVEKPSKKPAKPVKPARESKPDDEFPGFGD